MQNFISIRRRSWSWRICSFRLYILVSFSVFFGLFVTRTGRIAGLILTIYMPHNVLQPKDVPFGGFVDIAAYLGGQIPKNQFWGRE